MASITDVVIDKHRWYCIITIHRDDDTEEVIVIGADGDGLREFESYEAFEASI